MKAGFGEKSPLKCLEHKGFGSLFDDKFLPEQIAWAEIFLIKQTGENWPEEY